MPDLTVQDLIRQEATRQGVPPELALAVAQQESGFNPTATGITLPSGEAAVGTFQILPSTAKARGFDPHDPATNIKGGVGYLRELLDQHQGDLSKVLATYGGVRTNTTYVPGVLARIPSFRQAVPTTPASSTAAPTTPASSTASGPPVPSVLAHATDFGRSVLRGLDPRTEQGRRNIAGGAGAAAATMLAPEFALPVWLARAASVAVPLAGAYTGGAAENVAEQGVRAVTGAPPTPTTVREAGREQMGQEALGQGFNKIVFQPIMRRALATSVSKRISAGLTDAMEALKTRVGLTPSAVTPSKAGQMVEALTHGATGGAKTVKDRLGQEVSTAAAAGPDLPTAPLKARLGELASEVSPAADPQATMLIGGRQFSMEQAAQVLKQHPDAAGLAQIPVDMHLPVTLRLAQELTHGDTLPFADAHKIKRLLDSVVNWDRPSKQVKAQITKGFRQTLREEMRGHAPYNEATAAYGKVAKLYEATDVDKLHKEILSDPEGLVRRLGWDNPSGAQVLKELTVDVPAQGAQAGADQGAAAWDAVRAAWSHENLIAKGPAKMAAEIREMQASANGREFIATMYGDAAGQAKWKNLEQLSTAWETAVARAKAFKASDLPMHASKSLLRDMAYTALPGHGVTKVAAVGRLLSGPDAKAMIDWASAANGRTQFLIKHVLTGPTPGVAMADFLRWFKDSGGAPDRLAVSHEQGPPVPRVGNTSIIR